MYPDNWTGPEESMAVSREKRCGGEERETRSTPQQQSSAAGHVRGALAALKGAAAAAGAR
jgi:hypothetical protein